MLVNWYALVSGGTTSQGVCLYIAFKYSSVDDCQLHYASLNIIVELVLKMLR